MKVTLINHSDTAGGASVVTRRLTDALRAEGVDARMLVCDRRTDDPFVIPAGPKREIKKYFIAEHAKIFLTGGFPRKNIFKISIANCGLPLHSHPLVQDADIVVLNWINQGMLSLEEIGRIAAVKPVVWVMHDLWCATGVCHHHNHCHRFKDECGFCPLLGTHRFNDLSHKTFVRKRRLYSHAGITFVAVSNWLRNECRKSALLSRHDVKVIHNPFPVENFMPGPERPGEKKRIVMGAARLDDTVKDFPLAIETLNTYLSRYPDMTDRIEAVFYGRLRNPEVLEGLKMPHTWLGPVEQSRIPAIYADADVVLSTSVFETLPGTIIEGMSAGCIPVCTSSGGQSDIVDHLSTGYLVAGDCPADKRERLAEGLEWAFSAGPDRMTLHRTVEEKFSAAKVARQYMDLFNSIISDNK